MVKVFTLILVMSGLWANAFSQASASANASATIVEPISITKTIDSFRGNVAVIVAGTVVMTPVGSGSNTNNITLPVTSGTFTAACFYLSGPAGYTYTVTLPSTPLTFTNGSKTLKVSSFISDPTLNASTDMVAGVFVSVTPHNVTVNYN